jgi:hypothetical protein
LLNPLFLGDADLSLVRRRGGRKSSSIEHPHEQFQPLLHTVTQRLEEALDNPKTSAAHKAQLTKELEQLEDILVKNYVDRIRILSQ